MFRLLLTKIEEVLVLNITLMDRRQMVQNTHQHRKTSADSLFRRTTLHYTSKSSRELNRQNVVTLRSFKLRLDLLLGLFFCNRLSVD